eukprot:scaffold78194_cov69-Phaeocystis_antarctica.AAC.5
MQWRKRRRLTSTHAKSAGAHQGGAQQCVNKHVDKPVGSGFEGCQQMGLYAWQRRGEVSAQAEEARRDADLRLAQRAASRLGLAVRLANSRKSACRGPERNAQDHERAERTLASLAERLGAVEHTKAQDSFVKWHTLHPRCVRTQAGEALHVVGPAFVKDDDSLCGGAQQALRLHFPKAQKHLFVLQVRCLLPPSDDVCIRWSCILVGLANDFEVARAAGAQRPRTPSEPLAVGDTHLHRCCF